MVPDHLTTQVVWASAAEVLTKFSRNISQFLPSLAPEELSNGSYTHRSLTYIIIWYNEITHCLALFKDLNISY